MECARCGNSNLTGGQLVIPHRICAVCKKDWVAAGCPSGEQFVSKKTTKKRETAPVSTSTDSDQE